VETKIFNVDQANSSDKEGSFTAVLAVLNVVDRDNDILLSGCVGSGREVILSSWGHSSAIAHVPPVGRGRVVEEGGKLVLRAWFFLDTFAGTEAYKTLKGLGNLARFSFSLHDVLFDHRRVEGVPVRAIKSFRVRECSPVWLPASIGSRLVDIKGRTEAEANEALVAEIVEKQNEAALVEVDQNDAVMAHAARTLARTARR
jgi:hypothetical protein